MMIAFRVVGVAQPKGSAKAFIPKGWTRPVVTSDNPRNKGWQHLVADRASVAFAQQNAGDVTMLTGAVRLSVAFFLPRPKSLAKKTVAHLTRPDLDKLVRSVKDALTKVVWHDDGQVVEVIATKQYVGVNASPYVDIRIEPTAGCRALVLPAAPLPLLEALV